MDRQTDRLSHPSGSSVTSLADNGFSIRLSVCHWYSFRMQERGFVSHRMKLKIRVHERSR